MDIKKSIKERESIALVVAIRMARAAMGISQAELAAMLEISKVTLARIETLESPLKADVYMRAIQVFRSQGVDVELISASLVSVKVQQQCLDEALARLRDADRRRSDKKVSVAR